jgi:hypothetical protein
MTIQDDLIEKGYNKVPYKGKLYDLSCFEDCPREKADFYLDLDGMIFWMAHMRGYHFPGIYFRFKNGEILDLIRETRRLDRKVEELKEKLGVNENKLIELGYAKDLIRVQGTLLLSSLEIKSGYLK